MSDGTAGRPIDLKKMFESRQAGLAAALGQGEAGADHPGARGDASEKDWLDLLAGYLPNRYQVGKGFVIDCKERRSKEVDIIVFDRQYSPLLMEKGGRHYIPAESVYAVFEVKQVVEARYIRDAATKAASVRGLHRTSVPIHHAGGVLPPKRPGYILAGLLATRSSYRSSYRKKLQQELDKLPPAGRLDLGCCLQAGGFQLPHPAEELVPPVLRVSEPETALMSFLLWFLRQLQFSATVAAIDYEQYRRILVRKL